MCPSLSANHDANQNSELNKNQKYPKVMSKVSLMCYWHLCSEEWGLFYQTETVYNVIQCWIDPDPGSRLQESISLVRVSW